MCDELHPVVGLQCMRTDEHTVHRTERPKPGNNYHAKDVWIWWPGAFEKRGKMHNGPWPKE